MYCHNCGHELHDQDKFCPDCGAKQHTADQPQAVSEERPSTLKTLLKALFYGIVAVFFSFGLLIALVLILDSDDDTSEKHTPVETQAVQVQMETSPSTEAPTIPETTVPETTVPSNGWYTEDGKQYYYRDGAMCVNFEEIDGEYYYFYEDGSLAVNAEIEYELCTFLTDSDGIIERSIINQIGGEWGTNAYRFGNNGTSSVLELGIPVVDCTSMTFHLEAQGQRGAKVNGKWKIYVRHNDEWEFVQDINFTEPNGNFEIAFDEVKSFDAITAYPTVQGNASYVSLFYLENVDCSFQSVLNVM